MCILTVKEKYSMKDDLKLLTFAFVNCLICVGSFAVVSNTFFACLSAYCLLTVFSVYLAVCSKENIKNISQIIKAILYLITAFGVCLFPLLKYGISDSYGKVCFFLGIAVSYSILLYWYGTNVKQWKIENRFLTVVLTYGLFMMINMPIRIVPDEITHMLTSYHNANIILGIDSADSEMITLRQTDNDFLADNIEYACDYQMMNRYLDRYDDEPIQTEVQIDSINALNQNDISHVISGIPIAICKGLNANGFWTWISGRVINLAIYILLVYFAIKILPFGKRVPFTIALLPMSMQQAMSYSYDSWIISASIFVVSSAFALTYEKNIKHRKIIFIFCVCSAVSLVMMKSHAYFLIGLIPAFIWLEDHVDTSLFWKWFWRILGLIIAVFLVYAAADYVLDLPDIVLVPENPIGWMNGEQGYTVQYLINNPMQAVLLALRTVKNLSAMYVTTMISRGLGWLNINLSWLVFIVNCVLLFFSVNGEDGIELKKGTKYWMVLCTLITITGIFYGLMVNWTVVTSEIILGVQGRYFIPLLLVIGLLLYRKWKCTKMTGMIWDHLILFGYVMTVIELMMRF